MEYVKLGNTGLEVSRLCLGCMGFGEPGRGREKWSLDEEQSREIIKRALELGINFFDTANYYSLGSSEEILGRALKDFAKREEVVIASKLYFPMHEGPNAKGLSRKNIFTEFDKTLERLQTDYLDLYIIHRWDYNTPIEETMEALNDLVKMGKVRYIGASSMHAWQLAKANYIAEKNGWEKFVSMQDLYNLLYREEEREMVLLLKNEKIAMTPWSPLAQGRLTRDLGEVTERSKQESLSKLQEQYEIDADNEIIKRCHEIAEKKRISRGQVAMAWVLSKDYVTSPLVGATKIKYLEDAVGALEVNLTLEEIAYLESPYVPHKIVGYR
ncbi:MAG: aldo/keto reductase [Clostridiaceae bacterium]